MRALVFSSLYPNSMQTQFGLFVHRRVEALVRRGIEVRVVAPVPWVPPPLRFGRWKLLADIAASERLGEIRVTHPRYLHAPGPGMYVQAHNLLHGTLSHVKRLHREFDFDLIDAHYLYPDAVAATHIARKLGVPVAVTARGSDVNLLPRFATVRRQIAGCLRRADAVIGVSGALASAMQELGPSRHPRRAPAALRRAACRPSTSGRRRPWDRASESSSPRHRAWSRESARGSPPLRSRTPRSHPG
jgi:hypothetical protein